MVAAGSGRRISIKQFLYDWSPPAYDHPSLWQAPAFPTPHAVADAIAWTGVNFRGQHAACINLERTTLEVTVLDGDFEDGELARVCAGFKPVDKQARREILASPFASLAYQSRHTVRNATVPLSFWRHDRAPAPPRDLYAAENLPGNLRSQIEAVSQALAGFGYRLNSVFAGRSVAGPPPEVHFLFEGAGARALHLLVNPHDSAQGVAWPPIADDQKAQRRVRRLAGHDVHHAWLYDFPGPHEWVWRSPAHNCLLLVKPAPDTDLANATALAEAAIQHFP